MVRECERISGKELDQNLKAMLKEEAPPQMQEHLWLGSEEIGTDYKKVILGIEGYVRSKKKLGILEARLTWTMAQLTRAKVSPKERARTRAKVRATGAKNSQEPKGKSRQP